MKKFRVTWTYIIADDCNNVKEEDFIFNTLNNLRGRIKFNFEEVIDCPCCKGLGYKRGE